MKIMSILKRLDPKEIVRTCKNAMMDLRYGGFSGGSTRNLSPGANDNVSTDYAIMPQLFAGRISSRDVLVDIGCGSGRVINWWLSQGFTNRIYGLEQLQDAGESTRQRLRNFENVTIIVGDAIASIPDDGTFFYLFNPFDEPTMQRFVNRLRTLAERTQITVLYYAPVHINVFESDPFWKVEQLDILIPQAGHFLDRHKRFAVVKRAH